MKITVLISNTLILYVIIFPVINDLAAKSKGMTPR